MLLREIRLLDGVRVTISTNLELRNDGLPRSAQRASIDPGVAVYFFRRSKPYVFACDTWDTVEANLYAIGLHIDALRGQERWGVGTLEQQMRGYELPSSATARPWWSVLGVNQDSSLDTIEAAFRVLARTFHPDRGGSNEVFAEINAAIAAARAEKEQP